MRRRISGMKTIEERLEAITHTVELIAQMHLENERQSTERFKKVDTQIDRIVTITESLARIAQSHDKRIQDLEER